MPFSRLSRRVLLGAFASAPVASMPVVVAASGAAVASPLDPPVAENPALLKLGVEIDSLLAAYRAAAQRRLDARAAAENLSPMLPDDLVRKPRDRIAYACCTERETDVEGKDVWPPEFTWPDGEKGVFPPREILKAQLIKEAIARGNLPASSRSKIGKQQRRLIAIAEEYEAGRKAAIEASGIEAAMNQLRWAATDFQMTAYKMCEIDALTEAGVLVQARALAAWSEIEAADYGHNPGSACLGRTLAAGVLRMAGGSAS